MAQSLNSIRTPFKWALNFLIQLVNFRGKRVGIAEESINSYKAGKEEEEEEEECAICISKIEHGEETNESRCNHRFHRSCLDKWVIGFGQSTCPLCRDSIIPSPPAPPPNGGGVQVLVSKFLSFISLDDDDDDRHDTWWLR